MKALVSGIHDGRCRGCERRRRNGLSVYEMDDGGLMVLCYRCAAFLLAWSLGWRPDGLNPDLRDTGSGDRDAGVDALVSEDRR